MSKTNSKSVDVDNVSDSESESLNILVPERVVAVKGTKEKEPQLPNLRWTIDMEIHLLEQVKMFYGYLTSYDGKTKTKWCRINESFFTKYKHLKQYYENGNYRRLREKYTSLLKETKHVVTKGNSS